ncbi:probable helicase senataxin isoform X2 [Anoplophora glabripennis]|uniref:probable helicase senataxin isoform X2 n=1 Tax=Anoplophora glabripennis TaxID=217634 RepID=UPI0008755B25|nr:probable helicase senataxin isoform X2 [Anoplophora glabripennis]
METNTWCLKNIKTGEIISISKSVFRVGRNINADLTSLTNSLSRNHATFSILIDGLLYLQDNNSCNGTFVNDQKIQSMEMILIHEGDTIGFGCCEDLCKDRNFDTPPLIFTVLKKNNEAPGTVLKTKEEVQTVKGEFSSIPDCIIISDEEDDTDLFSNSQIYKISEKIKSEQTAVNENADPYYNIKQELEDLDCCDNNNQYIVDLTEEENCFNKTSDLLNILESPIQTSTHTVLNEESCLPSNQKYKTPPIIEPHFVKKKLKKHDSTPDNDKFKKQNDNIGNVKSTSKRKIVISSPLVKKKPRSSNLLTSKCDKKSIEKEFNKRSTHKSPSDKKKCNDENKNAILEERKKKLKEIANSNENSHSIKVKTAKHRAKVKNSSSRGKFLLEGCTNPQKNVDNTEPVPSTSKTMSEHTKMQTEDRKIQDTTITSNFSPKDDCARPKSLVKFANQTSHDCQAPDSTFIENRSGIIWKTATNLPGYLTKNVPKNVTIDDGICRLVHWSVNWLMEQNNIDRSPPVNGEVQPKRMPLHFKSFSEYVDTVSALTMLEVWQYVYQMLYSKDEERSPIKIFLNHKRIVGNLTYLDCECYLSEENVRNNTIPRMDDFALIELKLKDSMNSYMYTGFAYIKFCKRKYLNGSTQIDNHIAALCSGKPNVNLTFSMVTRSLGNKDIIGKQVMMKVIANIGSSLKLLKSVKYLETSPIGKNILLPKIEDFRVSSDDQDLIVEVNLNKEQKEIVLEASSLCLGNIPKLYLIKGPPGTGKSTVVVNIVLQIILRSIKDNTKEPPLILLSAPSNTAVDGLILKLADTRKKLPETQRRHMKMIRLGPESSISTSVDKFKLSSLARNHILKEHRLTSSQKYKDALNKGIDIDHFLKNHFGHNYYYEMKCAEDILLFGSNIICTTLNSSVGPRILEGKRRLKFTCCIVDEATQCTEPESLLPIQLGIEKIVLVGDPQQLPAVVCNKEAQQLGYGRSLFARIDENFANDVNSPIRMLCEQYRMKSEICEYPNKTFYNGKLKSFPIHINRVIPELKPYLLFNILNTENEDESPYRNSQEVGLIYSLLGTLKKFIKANCKYTIGIITPYRAQKEFLLGQIAGVKFNENVTVTVNTVDSFQGMENDVIIISCVRYAPNNFLQNEQRLNVALTRARQALYIIGNYSLFKHCQPLYDLREDAKKRRLCIDIKEFCKNIDFSKFIFKL